MSAPSRRTLLAAPFALGAPLPLAMPEMPESCLALGLKYGRAIKAYQAADVAQAPVEEMLRLHGVLNDAADAVRAAPVRTLGDVTAKLIVALSGVNDAVDNHDTDDLAEMAAAVVRDCLVACSQLTGIALSEFGVDFIDHALLLAMERGQ